MTSTICRFCGRQRQTVPEHEDRTAHRPATYAYAVHDSYGCDTGCCGFRYYACAEDGETVESHFDFMHDKEDFRQWAHERKLHIHWNECEGLNIND